MGHLQILKDHTLNLEGLPAAKPAEKPKKAKDATEKGAIEMDGDPGIGGKDQGNPKVEWLQPVKHLPCVFRQTVWSRMVRPVAQAHIPLPTVSGDENGQTFFSGRVVTLCNLIALLCIVGQILSGMSLKNVSHFRFESYNSVGQSLLFLFISMFGFFACISWFSRTGQPWSTISVSS